MAIDWTRRLRQHRTRRSATDDVDWRADTFVVIDLETTGLDPRNDHIVSYGAVPIREAGSRRPNRSTAWCTSP